VGTLFTVRMVSMSPRQSKEQLASTWIMGKPFEVGINQEFMKEVRSLVWATYRSGFEPMVETGHATDAGWGCMIRTGQMIVAEAMTKAGRVRQQVAGIYQDTTFTTV